MERHQKQEVQKFLAQLSLAMKNLDQNVVPGSPVRSMIESEMSQLGGIKGVITRCNKLQESLRQRSQPV